MMVLMSADDAADEMITMMTALTNKLRDGEKKMTLKLTTTWCIQIHWELIGGDMSASRVLCKLGGFLVYPMVYWDPPGSVMSDTGTLSVMTKSHVNIILGKQKKED